MEEVKRSSGHVHSYGDVWMDYSDYSLHRIQELIPTDWPLSFHLEFINECATNPIYDSLGLMTMGWEL